MQTPDMPQGEGAELPPDGYIQLPNKVFNMLHELDAQGNPILEPEVLVLYLALFILNLDLCTYAKLSHLTHYSSHYSPS